MPQAQVDRSRAETLARHHNCYFVEASAKGDTNVYRYEFRSLDRAQHKKRERLVFNDISNDLSHQCQQYDNIDIGNCFLLHIRTTYYNF